MVGVIPPVEHLLIEHPLKRFMLISQPFSRLEILLLRIFAVVAHSWEPNPPVIPCELARQVAARRRGASQVIFSSHYADPSDPLTIH